MRWLLLIGFITQAVFISKLHSLDKQQVIIDHGFLDNIPTDINLKNISTELNTLPKPTGSYQVGLKTIDLIDEKRDKRLVPIWIYFPMSPKEHILFPKVIEKRALDLFEIEKVWEKLEINVYAENMDNLNPLKGSNKHPIIFLNHGNGMLLSDYAYLAEDLASHGYIVIAIEHQLNTDTVLPAQLSKRTTYNWNLVIHNNLFVFEWLKENNKNIFFDTLNLKKIALIGHSMGAHASMLWADRIDYSGSKNITLFNHEDTTDLIECIITLDSRRIPFCRHNTFPLLMLMAGDRLAKQKQNNEYDEMKTIGHKFIYYKNAHHGSFVDMADLNVKTHIAPDFIWFYGSTEERMEFFDNVRSDIRQFLKETFEGF